MGLDMYLKAQRYVSKHDYSKPRAEGEYPEVTQLFKDTLALYPELNTGDIYGFEVSRCVAYWRKANAIHQWFVDNCQDGEDDCKEYYVGRESLHELLKLCQEVKAKHDPELAGEALPPQQGFFFGSTEIDQWYWKDIDLTIDQLTRILNDERLNEYDFYYQASW